MSHDLTARPIELVLDRSEALDLIHAVIDSTQEFLGEYQCADSERLSGALRTVVRLVEAMEENYECRRENDEIAS